MKKITLLLSVLFVTATSYGQVLIGWDVSAIELDDGSHSAPYTIAGVAAANISGGDLTLGSGVNSSTSAGEYGFKISGANEQTTLAGAITENHYIQFTLLADSGFVFNLTSLEINGQTSATGADDIAVMTSVDGFTSGDQIASLSGRHVVGTGDFDTDASGFGSAIDLSGAGYQNLTSLTIRLYGWNTTSSSGTTVIRNLSGDDLVINGTTAVSAVPEPSTYALIFGAAALGFCVYGRRARRDS